MAKLGRTKLYKEPRSCSLTTEAAWWKQLQVAADARIGNHSTPNSLVNEGIRMVLEKYKAEIDEPTQIKTSKPKKGVKPISKKKNKKK